MSCAHHRLVQAGRRTPPDAASLGLPHRRREISNVGNASDIPPASRHANHWSKLRRASCAGAPSFTYSIPKFTSGSRALPTALKSTGINWPRRATNGVHHDKRLARSCSLAFNIRQLSVRCRVAKFTNKLIIASLTTDRRCGGNQYFPKSRKSMSSGSIS